MKKISMFLSATILVFLVSLSYSQSLGDLADKEKQRRDEVKNSKTITDQEAAKYWTKSGALESSPNNAGPGTVAQKPESETKDSTQAKKPDPDEPVDFQGKTESDWRKTMSEARQKVKELEDESNALVLKVNRLQDQFYKESDGYRRETIQRDLQKGYYEQDLNKENLAKAKAALQDLGNEAQKNGALPGWIEDRNP
jgi:hypothetical protein